MPAREEHTLNLPHRRRTVALRGWGRLRTSRARLIPIPDERQARDAVQAGGALIARGLGRAYGDAATLDGGIVLDATRLHALGPVNAQTMRATIDAGGGVSLGEIVAATAPLGWVPPILPGTRHVTAGGAIAADVHGKNHHRDGSFGRYVRSFQLLTADGDILQVSRSDDRALFEATLGGMGLTGVITSARIELLPLPAPYLLVESQQTSDLDSAMEQLAEGDRTYPYSVAWLDLATPGQRARGIVQHGCLASARAVEAHGKPHALRRRPALPVPPLPGRGLVRPTVIQGFNSLYWMLPRSSPALVSLDKYFHPLDALSQWPRLYGKAGFHQYQFVVPTGAEPTVRQVVERFAAGPVTPSLAVLKRMGPADEGMLSFPLEGWTLAVDLPAYAHDLGPLLDEFDELVAAAGGRVYLAKDARLRPELLPAMYPRLDEWREQKERIDPEHRFRSDLAERLRLVRPRDVR